MSRHIPVKNSSQLTLDTALLQKLVVELNECNEQSLVGGVSQRLQEEFSAELATLRSINPRTASGDVTPIEEIGVVGRIP